LIILDVNLPKMDGYQFARILKQKRQFADTVILMLSGRDGILDRLKGRLAGASGYMTKPFKTADLVHLVNALLGVPQP
jgi:DNA-binding response OmpR family regulator